MKILHTSDWHIGRTLYGRKRYEEFEAFLNWLVEILQKNTIDVLLVAGDVFDSSIPSHRAQQLYYRFLCCVAESSCRHVVIIAGNHDSPSFLNAPKELLKTLDVHVIGNITQDPSDEILVLYNERDVPELMVCAVPYLRDKDIRVVEAGEGIEDKDRKLLEGIRNHYAIVADLAKKECEKLGSTVPIVAMGHLFTSGGQTIDGDGVLELYIGSLAHVTASIFSEIFSYVALGHLHVPQKVKGSEIIRYSGSPIPMGFGEAKQQKSVCQVEFQNKDAAIKLIEVPVFQKLERIKGDWNPISSRIAELSKMASPIWLEVIYEGDGLMSDLSEKLAEMVAGSSVEILRVKNNRIINSALGQMYEGENLDDLDESDMFAKCLAVHEVPQDQAGELFVAYGEILSSLREEDLQAE